MLKEEGSVTNWLPSTAFEIGVIFSSVVFTTGGGVGNVDSPTAHKWASDSSLVQPLLRFRPQDQLKFELLIELGLIWKSVFWFVLVTS